MDVKPSWLDDAERNGLIATVRSVNPNNVLISLSITLPKTINEAAFQQLIVTLAKENSWMVAHCRKVKCTSRKRTWWETPMAPGWFDLTLVRDGVMAFVEVKVPPNKQTKDQVKWFNEVSKVPNVHCYVWTPDDWKFIHKFLTQPKEKQ